MKNKRHFVSFIINNHGRLENKNDVVIAPIGVTYAQMLQILWNSHWQNAEYIRVIEELSDKIKNKKTLNKKE